MLLYVNTENCRCALYPNFLSGPFFVWRLHRTCSADINTSVLQVTITATTIQLMPHKAVQFLTKEDWKYEASTAGTKGGGRTHTFGLRRATTKLKNAAVYQRKDVRITGGKAVPANGD